MIAAKSSVSAESVDLSAPSPPPPAGDNLMFTAMSLVTVSGEAFLLILCLVIIIVLGICLVRAPRHRPKHAESYNNLWVHMRNNYGGLAFGMSDMEPRDDDEDEEDSSPNTQPPDKCLSTSRQAENIDSFVLPGLTFASARSEEEKEEERQVVENMVFPALTFASTTKEEDKRQDGDGGVLDQVSVEVEEQEEPGKEGFLGDDVTGQTTMVSADSSDYCEEEEEEEEDEEQVTEMEEKDVSVAFQQNPPTTYPKKQNDLSHIEEIYAEVSRHTPREKVKASDSDERSEEEATGLQPPQVVVPQTGAEYDDVVLNRRIKKPKNIEDVEEIYDVVVNQLTTRKDSTSTASSHSKALHSKAYAVYTIPAAYEFPISTNKAYAPSDNVTVSTNEAYKPFDAVKRECHTYDSVN